MPDLLAHLQTHNAHGFCDKGSAQHSKQNEKGPLGLWIKKNKKGNKKIGASINREINLATANIIINHSVFQYKKAILWPNFTLGPQGQKEGVYLYFHLFQMLHYSFNCCQLYWCNKARIISKMTEYINAHKSTIKNSRTSDALKQPVHCF